VKNRAEVGERPVEHCKEGESLLQRARANETGGFSMGVQKGKKNRSPRAKKRFFPKKTPFRAAGEEADKKEGKLNERKTILQKGTSTVE